MSPSLLLFCIISITIICYLRIIIMKKLINLNCLPCYCHCAAFLFCLLLLKTLGYHQFHWPSMFWFIHSLVCKSSKIHWLANNKKLMNLDCLACCSRCVVVLLYLLLLTVSPDIISFLNFKRFIDLLITSFVSFLEYIDLLITKKLMNLDYLAHCCYCACYS